MVARSQGWSAAEPLEFWRQPSLQPRRGDRGRGSPLRGCSCHLDTRTRGFAALQPWLPSIAAPRLTTTVLLQHTTRLTHNFFWWCFSAALLAYLADRLMTD